MKKINKTFMSSDWTKIEWKKIERLLSSSSKFKSIIISVEQRIDDKYLK